ncbi:MAG: hypothetical protein ABDI20_04375 [Candidatus Bipolaricaulaceae bacterium]
MQERDLWSQGDFVIYKKGGGELDAPYLRLGPYPEGKLYARLRARSVEIDYALGQIDAARVTFIDPERAMAGYLAEVAKSPNYEAHAWTVGVGYHFAPPTTWAWFTGVPVLEDVRFTANEPPEVVVRLLDPTVVLMRNNSSLHGRKSRHWLYPPQEPPSIRKALQELASYYEAELVLGRLEKVIAIFDDHLAYYADDPTGYILSQDSAGPTWDIPDILMPHGGFPEVRAAVRYFHARLGRGFRDVSDWDYLLALKAALQELVNKFVPEDTLGISDEYWSKVRRAGNEIVVMLSQGKLWFATLKDVLQDRLSFISVFSYQMDDCSLLEFTAEMSAQAAGAQASALIAQLFGRRSGVNQPVEYTVPSTTVFTGRDDPLMRVRVPEADPEAGDVRHLGSIQRIRMVLAPHTREWDTAPLEQVLGDLATTMRATATVLGSPWLRAGMLVGTRGLGVGPENRPEENEPVRINTYDRVWLASRVTHSVDESGLYLTRLELMGASSDDSAQKMREGWQANVFRSWAKLIAEQDIGRYTLGEQLQQLPEKLLEYLMGLGWIF